MLPQVNLGPYPPEAPGLSSPEIVTLAFLEIAALLFSDVKEGSHEC